MLTDVPLHAVALVCTLSPSPEQSSSDLLATQLLAAMGQQGVVGHSLRMADLDIKPGVKVDMGAGDAWPMVRERVLDADILILATPIWLGHPSSIAQRVMERLDAELSNTDEQGRLLTYGKVAVVAVVGNEDGAHHVSADIFQALSDCGFTIPANGATYWTGEAMKGVDYRDLEETPKEVVKTTATVANNAIHLATLLRSNEYPPS